MFRAGGHGAGLPGSGTSQDALNSIGGFHKTPPVLRTRRPSGLVRSHVPPQSRILTARNSGAVHDLGPPVDSSLATISTCPASISCENPAGLNTGASQGTVAVVFFKSPFVACHFPFSPPFFSTYVRVRALRRPCPSDFRKHFGRGSAARGESEAAVLQFTQAPFPLPL